jgi:hypothetical protein
MSFSIIYNISKFIFIQFVQKIKLNIKGFKLTTHDSTNKKQQTLHF